MPKYNVTLTTSANTTVTVEADSPEAAYDAALLVDDLPTLCHQCTGGYRGAPELILGDDWDLPDGEQSNFITEEADQ